MQRQVSAGVLSDSNAFLESLFEKVKLGEEKALKEIKKKDASGISLLHVLAKNGHAEFIEYLVENELDKNINSPDTDARTPLHWACWKGRTETVKVLLEMGAIQKPTRTGFTRKFVCFFLTVHSLFFYLHISLALCVCWWKP